MSLRRIIARFGKAGAVLLGVIVLNFLLTKAATLLDARMRRRAAAGSAPRS